MKRGVVLPKGSAREQVELAILAERHGWDGVFVWEGPYGTEPWTVLGAMAAQTDRVELGTMLTPLPFLQPWKVASQVVTLDQISEGRAILAVGLGDTGLFGGIDGLPTDIKTRAARLDEGIDLINTLWSGTPVYEGTHFKFDMTGIDEFEVEGQTRADIPIWVTGVLGRDLSMRRVLRCSGILPLIPGDGGNHRPEPTDVADVRTWLRSNDDANDRIAVIAEGETQPGNSADMEKLRLFEESGATWWLETRWSSGGSVNQLEDLRQRILAG